MEGLGLLLVIWILSTVFEKFRDAQRRGSPPEELPRPRRERHRPRAPRPAPPPPAPTPAESAEDEWRRELERIFGVPVPGPTGPTGPTGRRADRPLPPAEEVEEAVSLESEPELINIDEVALEQPPPVPYDQDAGAEELVQRRIRAGEDRSHALTKADHARFDRSIREAAPPAAAQDRTAVASRRPGLREAFIWKEILGPPVALRRPED